MFNIGSVWIVASKDRKHVVVGSGRNRSIVDADKMGKRVPMIYRNAAAAKSSMKTSWYYNYSSNKALSQRSTGIDLLEIIEVRMEIVE